METDRVTHGVHMTHERGDLAMIGQGLAATWIPKNLLHPLPEGMSAEAQAVLDAADKWERSPYSPQNYENARTALESAVRAYRASLAPPEPPDPVEMLAEALSKIASHADRNHTGCNPQLLGDDVTKLAIDALAAVERVRQGRKG